MILPLLSFPYSPSNTGAERNIKEYARYGDSGPHLCPADGSRSGYRKSHKSGEKLLVEMRERDGVISDY